MVLDLFPHGWSKTVMPEWHPSVDKLTYYESKNVHHYPPDKEEMVDNTSKEPGSMGDPAYTTNGYALAECTVGENLAKRNGKSTSTDGGPLKIHWRKMGTVGHISMHNLHGSMSLVYELPDRLNEVARDESDTALY